MAFTVADVNMRPDQIFTLEFWHTRSHHSPLGFRGKVDNLATLIGAANRNVERGQHEEASWDKVASAAQELQASMQSNTVFRKLYLGPTGKHRYFFDCLDSVVRTAMSNVQNFVEIERTRAAIKNGTYQAAGKEKDRGDNYGSWA